MTTGLKVHLRVLELHRTTLRIVTLRPQTGVRFSSNYFHDTWHILGGPDAAAILGRLLWGLAFQRHPGTLVHIDHEHLLRANALSIFRMSGSSEGYCSLAEHTRGNHWRVDGEVQVIEHFARDVSAATVARREILGGESRAIATEAERCAIYQRKDEVLRR